jgi:L-alanine-DL-glutamate epimerase-like enolase superfamily enzyme
LTKPDTPVLRSLAGTAVKLPMKRPLGTSAKSIEDACLLLVDLFTEDGIKGHAYAFCYQPSIARSLVLIVAELSAQLAGKPLVPLDLAQAVSRYFRLPGVTGPLAMVASSVDTAVWDALAKSAGVPLATYLGASLQPIPAYNSNGLGLMSPEAAADEAEALLEGGFTAVKLRLGRSQFEHDLATVRAVRRRLPDSVRLMVDFNQALTFSEAMQYALALDDEGIYWIEEPIRHDDYRHMARSAHLMAATPGRHWLEYVDWADPILQEPLQIKDGAAIISDRPGNGLAAKISPHCRQTASPMRAYNGSRRPNSETSASTPAANPSSAIVSRLRSAIAAAPRARSLGTTA